MEFFKYTLLVVMHKCGELMIAFVIGNVGKLSSGRGVFNGRVVTYRDKTYDKV